MVALALLHGALLASVPSAPLVALGVWWNSNTISHNFIHRPFFRRRGANVLFGAYLSVLLGIPQVWWRARHLAHHGIRDARGCDGHELGLQIALVAGVWTTMLLFAPSFFVFAYMPGYAAGLLLCALHGHYEHARGTISHYGALYNLVCFNDGYHVEHHQHPGVSWRRLPAYRAGTAPHSRWPAPLRWMETFSLTTLERIVLRSRILQRSMVTTHARALASLLKRMPPNARVGIVGGGLFPRTALALRSVAPGARLTIVDADRDHLDCARRLLSDERVSFVHARFPEGLAGLRPCDKSFDVVIIPLAFDGDRESLYVSPPARTTVVHDWIWNKRGESRVVSPLLLKRINVVHT
jgi:Fatty acid desaturase